MEYPSKVIPIAVAARPLASGPTFLDLAHEWFDAERKRVDAPENLRRHIGHLSALWGLTEAQLGPRAVKEALYALLEPVGPLGAATVNKVRATGRSIIRDALENERWSKANPFDVVRRMKQAQPVFRTLSLAEARLAMMRLRPDRRLEALVMLYMGLRPGELLGMCWDDVDFVANTTTVRRSHGRNKTKTGKVRVVPLLPALLPLFRDLSREAKGQRIFHRGDGERQRADSKKTRMLREALRKAGLIDSWEYSCRRKGCGHKEESKGRQPGSRCPKCNMKLWEWGVAIYIRWYDLRHSCATLHREAGADPLAIQLLLGHAPKSLTDSTYTHLSMEYLRRELSKLAV